MRIPTFSIDISRLEPAKSAERVEGVVPVNGIFDVAGGDQSQESQAGSESPQGEEPDEARPIVTLGDAARRSRSVIHQVQRPLMLPSRKEENDASPVDIA